MEEKTQWQNCVLYGGPAQYSANLAKGTHVLIEGELTYREYNRTIETESASVNAQWPLVEIVVESLKVLDRKKREGHEGAA